MTDDRERVVAECEEAARKYLGFTENPPRGSAGDSDYGFWDLVKALLARHAAGMLDAARMVHEYTEKEQRDHEQFRPYSSPMYYAQAAEEAIRESAAALAGGEENGG